MSSFRRLDVPLGASLRPPPAGIPGATLSRPSSLPPAPPLPPVPRRAPGTKSWINGQTLISTGNKELDGVLGGGLCLGTLSLIEEDRFSDHALILAKYFVAQGVGAEQKCLVIGAEGQEELEEMFVENLPLDLTHKKMQAAAKEAQENDREKDNKAVRPSSSSSSSSSLSSSPPSATSSLLVSPLSNLASGLQHALPPIENRGAVAAGPGGGGDPLSIAWQYRKYMGGGDGAAPLTSNSSSSSSSSFCHSYDLSRRVQPELLAVEKRRPQVINLSLEEGKEDQFTQVLTLVSQALKSLGPNTILRVLLKSFLGRTTTWHTDQWRRGFHLLHSLRTLARGQPVAILVTFPAHHLSPLPRQLFTRVADTVLELESFAGRRHLTPGEFEAFAGLLHVKALQHVNALAPVRGSSNKWGIKRDRRKLHVEPLHLPPEGVRTLTEDVEKGKKKGGGVMKKGAAGVPGMICATSGRGGGGGGNSLDF